MFRISVRFLLTLMLPVYCLAQTDKGPVVRFAFNNNNELDEVSKRKAKLVGVKFAEDRFGNENNAVYLFGNEFSYVNLGNYPALKPTVGSISLWVKIELEVYAGKGTKTNPIILTKCNDRDDF